MPKPSRWWSTLGPGIVWASTSIGVSHVVQSTRAGAEFGFTLLGIVILANAIKYPFFQMGPRYAAATGESLVEGYHRIGRFALAVFLALTFVTMFIVQAGVTIVAAGVAANRFPCDWSVTVWSGILLLIVLAILLGGGYGAMDRALKGLMLVFAVATLVAVTAAGIQWTPAKGVASDAPSLLAPASIAFVVALVGWMPTAIELSVWQSLWTLSRGRQTGRSPTPSAALFDFNFGYVFCLVFAVAFLLMGAFTLFGSGAALPSGAVAFTGQLIDLYAQAVGQWSRPWMALIIFIAMFSTVLAVADGFPRVWQRAMGLMLPDRPQLEHKVYAGTLIGLGIGAVLLIGIFASNLRALVDFATTVSFVSAPVYAWFNLRAMNLPHVGNDARLGIGMQRYSAICLGLLTAFSLYFLYWRFL